MTRAEKFAKLIKISLQQEEIPLVEHAIDSIVEMATELAKIDTKDIKPLFYTIDSEDLTVKSEELTDSCHFYNKQFSEKEKHPHNLEDIFKNAQQVEDYFFTSPLVIKKN